MFGTATLLLVSVTVITTESSPLTCSSLQGCSTSDWIKCAGVVAECASACGQSITSQSCTSCLGDATSYNQCKDCFSLAEEIKYQEAIVQKIQASNAVGCSRWDWFKCAQAVHSARCSSECVEGLTSQACVSHLGSSYDQCANCFALAETVKKSESLVGGCDPWEWVQCGLDIGECAVDCGWECISCIYDSIEECIGCLTAVDVIKNIESYKNDSGVHSKEDFSVFKTTNPTVQGCSKAEWAKCGGTILKCAFDCGRTCLSCIASTLLDCLSCIPAVDVIRNIESRKSGKDLDLHGIKKFSELKTRRPTIQGCNPLDVAACAGVVGGCAAECSAADSEVACIACMGGSYSTCKDCF